MSDSNLKDSEEQRQQPEQFLTDPAFSLDQITEQMQQLTAKINEQQTLIVRQEAELIQFRNLQESWAKQKEVSDQKMKEAGQLIQQQEAEIKRLQQEKASAADHGKKLQAIQEKLQSILDKSDSAPKASELTTAIKTMKDNLSSVEVSLSMMRNDQADIRETISSSQEKGPWWWQCRVEIFLVIIMLLMLLLSHRINTLSDQMEVNRSRVQRILWNVTYPDNRIRLTDPLNDVWNNQITYENEQKKSAE